MPGPADQDRSLNAVSDDIRALLREHQLLRNDVERLLQEKQQLLEEKGKNGNGNQKDGGQKKGAGGDGGEGGGKEGEDGKEGERKKPKGEKGGDQDEKDENKEQPKPPLKDRAKAWISEHPLGFLLILVALIGLAVATYLILAYLQTYVTTDDAQIDGHTHQISSRISGTVTGVYVEDNRSVQAGQTLADLDPRDYQAALAEAQARLAQANAELEAQAPNVPITQTTEATNVATAQLDIANGQAALQGARQNHQSSLADLRQAEANLENAQIEERRYRNLADKQEVSREVYDQKATAARSQQALVASRKAVADAAAEGVRQREAALAQVQERAKEVVNNRPREVAVQHATVATRRANVEAAKAQVLQASLNLGYCKILAPVAGIVGSKTVEVGQQVAPGQELLAVTSVDDIWVIANFKETQISRMRPGQEVTIHVDAIDLKFNGYVQDMPGATGAKYSLLPPENATGNYVKVVQRLPVRIRFKPGQPGYERLRPGMSVEPKVWVQ